MINRNGKNLVFTLFIMLFISANALAAAGDLDTSFNFNGIKTTASGDARDTAIAVLPSFFSGDFIVVGNSSAEYSLGDNNIVLVKYQNNGSLDTTFGVGGKVKTTFGRFCIATAAVQTSTKIIVVGYTAFDNIYSAAIIQYNLDGSLDTSFDGDGVVLLDPISGSSAKSIAIQEDGKLVVAGDRFFAFSDFWVARLNVDGSLDSSFNNSGIFTLSIGSQNVEDKTQSLLIQNDGKLVVSGSSGVAYAVFRLNTNGILDQTFDNDGITTTAFAGGNFFEHPSATYQSADGKIVLCGYSTLNNVSDITFVRYNANGSLDQTFDGDGIVKVSIPSKSSRGLSVTNDGTNIYASGFSYTSNTNYTENSIIVKLNLNGTLNTTFGSNGIVSLPSNSLPNITQAIAVQPAIFGGKIYAVGNIRKTNLFENYESNDFLVYRLNPNGTFDSTLNGGSIFNTSGIVKTGELSSNAIGKDVAIQSDGKIVVVGTVRNLSTVESDVVVARYNPDGSPDTSFGIFGTGVVTINFDIPAQTYTPVSSSAQSVIIQPDGRILVVAKVPKPDNTNGFTPYLSGRGFALARLNQNGFPDLSFGGTGRVITSIRFSSLASDASLRSDGKIVVVGVSNDFFNPDLDPKFRNTVARYNTNGTLDSAFGVGGIVTTQNSSFIQAQATTVAIQPDNKMIVGGFIGPVIASSRVSLVRYNENGSLDTTFAGDGTIELGEVIDSNQINSIALQTDGKVITCGRETLNSIFIKRITVSGDVDSTFQANYPFTNFSNCNTLAIQSDGKVVAGSRVYSSSGESSNFGIVRFNTDGSLDNSAFAQTAPNLFGNGGIVTTSVIPQRYNSPESIIIQPDGKIVVAGTANANLAVVRYLGLSATAASANINGRVKTANGRGIARVRVSITKPNGETQFTTTNPFGYYRFQDLAVGETYILNVSSKRYSFAEPTRVISLNEKLTDADFVSVGN
jgi:uncharacterized delta-60 repeat protein